jgi:hypothetical protein
MIGRALRGKQAGGTEEAHLVTFVDTWRDFGVLDTAYVVNAGEVEARAEVDHVPATLIPIERELVLETYKLVRSNVKGSFVGTFECLPNKWFSWDAEFNDDIQTRHLMVFENQVAGYERLLQAFGDPSTIPEEISEDRGRALVREYWGDCQDPLPSWIDVVELLIAKRHGVVVHEYTFEEKRRFAPERLAQEIWAKDLGERAKLAELQQRFEADPVCRLVYRGDVIEFRKDVQAELDKLGGVSPVVPHEVVARVPKLLRSWPEGTAGHGLTALLQKVAEQPVHFPGGMPVVRDIFYMKRPSRDYYGFFRYSDGVIQINPTLNSPDVPKFVMEFLVYHEMLHADLPSAGHNRNFKERERRFRPSGEAAEEARAGGFEAPETPDSWRVLADQVLDTIRLQNAGARGAM